MPIYEYECRHCGDRFERLVSLREANRATKCPQCGSRSARKLMSAFSSIAGKSDGQGECPTCTTGTCDL